MKNYVKSVLASIVLLGAPLTALSNMAPIPGQPGYNPNVPTYKPTRTIWLRHPDGKVQIELTEAYEPHHYDYMKVYGPRGVEYMVSRCSDLDWNSSGYNTDRYINTLVRTICQK